jgi:hypothetical protein
VCALDIRASWKHAAVMEDVATFEDLSIDDTLDIVERVRKYAISSIALQR